MLKPIVSWIEPVGNLGSSDDRINDAGEYDFANVHLL